MKTNMSTLDRSIRIVAGVAILFFVPSTLWAWVGLLPLMTGLTGFCPLYRVFGWSTKQRAAST
jgi:hypothetical protein